MGAVARFGRAGRAAASNQGIVERHGGGEHARTAVTHYTILWLAVIDWDAPWQGQQTLASRLAADGHAVTFVETPGVRPIARRDWRRVRNRLRNRACGGLWGFRPLAKNLWRLSPVLIPLPGRTWADAINRQVLRASLRRLPACDPGAPLMIWSYLPTPLAVRLVQDLRPARLIYHCINATARNPAGIAPGTVEAEDWLVRHADHVFATARQLAAERRAKNPCTTYLPEAADVAPFMASRSEPADLAGLSRPRICFFGTLDVWLDQDLLSRVAAAHRQASIVLIGPARCDFDPLRRFPNVHLLGARSHDSLPGYLQHMDVLIIPYRITPYTTTVHPVKTYEALATGKPLVATDLPELRPYAGPVAVARDGDEFLAAIRVGLAETDPAAAEARRALARQNTWEARIRAIKEKLPELA
jgi:glycosyltransferase involved in cell wall biosynthesis